MTTLARRQEMEIIEPLLASWTIVVTLPVVSQDHCSPTQPQLFSAQLDSGTEDHVASFYSSGASVRRLFPVCFQKIASNTDDYYVLSRWIPDAKQPVSSTTSRDLPHNPIGGHLVPVQD